MTGFQIFGLGLLGALVIVAAIGAVRRPGRAAVSLLWIGVWIAAGFAIALPDGTTAIARRVGIQRGADLVSYCAILAGLIGFFVVYLRLRQLNRQITLIVRSLALHRPRLPPERDPG
jgi:hypothetical protein